MFFKSEVPVLLGKTGRRTLARTRFSHHPSQQEHSFSWLRKVILVLLRKFRYELRSSWRNSLMKSALSKSNLKVNQIIGILDLASTVHVNCLLTWGVNDACQRFAGSIAVTNFGKIGDFLVKLDRDFGHTQC
ncbi:hypothetical protein EZV62_027627 [Acer yangbiense]|uniref:Uncharacterized protein n=1 Tax=Acer yangbiense TaxID=1000413 RepID=A0A5C7GUI5_9ROSI|nr:hypothetical protein EZV62_027627 [Acer yangbiense]